VSKKVLLYRLLAEKFGTLRLTWVWDATYLIQSLEDSIRREPVRQKPRSLPVELETGWIGALLLRVYVRESDRTPSIFCTMRKANPDDFLLELIAMPGLVHARATIAL
jgi:hypothetical protein